MISDYLPEGWKVGDVHQVRLPTFINVSKNTRKSLNLNVYRNLHHHHLNKQKQNFHDEVKPLIRDLPRAEKIWLHYTIFAPRNGRLDTMNVGSIVDKYFSDTLVESKKIMDDHFDHVVLVSFSFGGVRPMDGHAIANIHILEETEPMRVLLDEDDIQLALDAHVKSLNLPGATGVDLSVNDDGDIEAEVLMGDVKPKSKGGRPRGSKNKTTAKAKAAVKEEATDAVETDSEGGSDSSDSGGSDASAEPVEEQAKPDPKGSTKNPSGEEESPSSSSTEEAEKTPDTPKVRVKKSSIFDVD